jgi:hypothetical protein
LTKYRRRTYNRKLQGEKEKKKPNHEICTCCNIRPVHDGFRFLCWQCYVSQNDSRMDTYNNYDLHLPGLGTLN